MCPEAALPAEAPPAHAAAAQQVIGAHGAPAVSAGECPEAAPPAEAARHVSGEHGAQPVSDSACPEAGLPAVAAPPKTKYPRVGPPGVEDESGTPTKIHKVLELRLQAGEGLLQAAMYKDKASLA